MARTVLLLALVLALPVIVLANPIDPSWQPGWYDDHDTDQLVTQSMSPESMMGIATLVLGAWMWVPLRLAREPARHSRMTMVPEPVPRGPVAAFPGDRSSLPVPAIPAWHP